MKKYIMKQAFSVSGENEEYKHSVMQICINEEGVEKQQIMGLLNHLSCDFIRFMGEEAGVHEDMENFGNLESFSDMECFGDMKGEKENE